MNHVDLPTWLASLLFLGTWGFLGYLVLRLGMLGAATDIGRGNLRYHAALHQLARTLNTGNIGWFLLLGPFIAFRKADAEGDEGSSEGSGDESDNLRSSRWDRFTISAYLSLGPAEACECGDVVDVTLRDGTPVQARTHDQVTVMLEGAFDLADTSETRKVFAEHLRKLADTIEARSGCGWDLGLSAE